METSRNNKLFNILDLKIQQLQSAGIIQKLIKDREKIFIHRNYIKPKMLTKEYLRDIYPKSFPEGPKVLTMEHLEAGFFVWLTSLTLALITFILELINRLIDFLVVKNILTAFYALNSLPLQPRKRFIKHAEEVSSNQNDIHINLIKTSFIIDEIPAILDGEQLNLAEIFLTSIEVSEDPDDEKLNLIDISSIEASEDSNDEQLNLVGISSIEVSEDPDYEQLIIIEKPSTEVSEDPDHEQLNLAEISSIDVSEDPDDKQVNLIKRPSISIEEFEDQFDKIKEINHKHELDSVEELFNVIIEDKHLLEEA